MKRLNCTYELKKDPMYPWLLKHPKIKIGLAKFKTREEALQWYMNLEFETAVWFQNDENVWDGQLTCDSDSNNEWFYYIKTAGFDGGATYNGVCHELNINPSTFKYQREDKEKFLEELDYVLISNPATYFPQKLEIAKKSHRKEMVDIDAIRNQFQEQINLLLLQINNNNKEADRELELLKEELAKKDANFDELARRMELLKQGNNKALEGVSYVSYLTLNHDDYVGALVLYNEKLRNILETTAEQTISKQDFVRIHDNYNHLSENLNAIEQDPKFQNKKLVAKLRDELNSLWSQLVAKLKVDEKLKDEPLNAAYYFNSSLKNNQSIAWETSYVLVDLMHVGFVAKEKYYYAIPYLATRTKYAITVINENDTTQTITIKSSEHELNNEAVVAPVKSSKPKAKKAKQTKAVEEEIISTPVTEDNKEDNYKVVQQEEFIVEKPAKVGDYIEENDAPVIYTEVKKVPVVEEKVEVLEEKQNPIIYTTPQKEEHVVLNSTKEEVVEEKQNPIIYPAEKETKVEKVEVIEEEKPVIYTTPLNDNHIVIFPVEEKVEKTTKKHHRKSTVIVEELKSTEENANIKVLKDESKKEDDVVSAQNNEIIEEIIYVQHPKETHENAYVSNNLDSEFSSDEEAQPIVEEENEDKNNENAQLLPKHVEKEIKRALHPHRGWFWFWFTILVLILIGVIVLNILAIIQLAGGFITFP